METNLYDYDTTVQWTLRPRDPRLPQYGAGQKPRVPEKMPKARALALAQTLKKWLAVVSIVGFGTFSGLVALHQVGTTASQSTQTSSGSSTTSTSSSSSQKSNSFLNQGGNNLGSSTSSSTAASGSSVS
jgi:hypothetical protein